MTRFTLAFRSFAFHRRRYLVLSLGTMLSVAVVIAALVSGASVRESITAFNRDRIGTITHLLETPDRLFSADLERRAGGGASALHLRGAGTAPSGREVPAVEMYGVTSSFFSMFPGFEGDTYTPRDEGAVVSGALARSLSLSEGDSFTLRFRPPDRMRSLFPASSAGTSFVSIRLTAERILPDSGPGRFDPGVNQKLPLIAYVDLPFLSRAAGVPGAANLHAFTTGDEKPADAILSYLSLEDAGYSLEGSGTGDPTGNGSFVLRAPGGFLERAVLDAAGNIDPSGYAVYSSFVISAAKLTAGGVEGGRTAYGFFVSDPRVEGVLPGPWLSSRLSLERGDALRIGRFTWDEAALVIGESFVDVSVSGFATGEALAARRKDVPEFPGLSGAVSCSDWSSAVPIDFSRVTPEEEAYWKEYGTTPRFLVSTALGKELSPYAASFAFSGGLAESEIRKSFSLEPGYAALGFSVRPVRRIQLDAGSRSTDFTSLLLGMSFFLIASGVMLVYFSTRLFYRSRRESVSVLFSLGFSGRSVRNLLLLEALPSLFLGAAAGVAAGAVLPHLILAALRSVWIGATRTSALSLYSVPYAFPAGLAAGVIPSFAAVFSCIRRSVPAGLRKRGISEKTVAPPAPGRIRPSFAAVKARRSPLRLLVPAVAAVLLGWSLLSQPGGSFSASVPAYAAGAGTLVLMAFLFHEGLVLAAARTADTRLGLSLARTGRERGRRMLPFLVISASLFVLLSVAVNRRVMLFDPEDRNSPTGGFVFLVETSSPVPVDRKSVFEGTAAFRRSGTDEANCLNLNFVTNPSLLGADTAFLSERNAFSIRDGSGRSADWTALEGRTERGFIPAFADSSVLAWGIGKKIGDALPYAAADGRTVYVEIVGELNDTPLQGNLIISADNLVKNFPAGAGPVFFLVDGQERDADTVSRRFSEFGSDVRPVAAVLSDFLELENTYLEIFAALGTIAFILGWCAFALSVKGDAIDEAGSVAVMRKLGFPRKRIVSERRLRYLPVFCCAWLAGTAGAAVSALPVLGSRNGAEAFLALLGSGLPLLVSGAAFSWFSSGTID